MQKFKVVKYTFASGTEDQANVVKKNLTERKAKALRDQLNSKTELSADVETIVGYRIAPMGNNAHA